MVPEKKEVKQTQELLPDSYPECAQVQCREGWGERQSPGAPQVEDTGCRIQGEQESSVHREEPQRGRPQHRVLTDRHGDYLNPRKKPSENIRGTGSQKYCLPPDPLSGRTHRDLLPLGEDVASALQLPFQNHDLKGEG